MQQPIEESKKNSKMGNKRKHYKNNVTGPVLLNIRICCSSMGEIYIRRHITGYLKPTYVENMYFLVGIVPPDIRRDVCARMERNKQMEQETHSLFGHKK